jgi:hypothetical protein
MRNARSLGALAVVLGLFLAACDEGALAPTADNASDQFRVAASASTSTSNVKVPFAQVAFVPCAADGAGELVLIEGILHIVDHVTVSNSGNITLKIHFQPQGATGTGLTTGDTYQSNGVTQETLNINGLPITDTFVNNFRLIGPGPGNNLQVHQTIHITINANGDLTADVNNTSITCS